MCLLNYVVTMRKIRSGQQEVVRRRPLGGTVVGGNRMPSSRREPPAFYGNLKKELVNSSCAVRQNNSNLTSSNNNIKTTTTTTTTTITTNNNAGLTINNNNRSGGIVLDVDRLNVLKKNKCKETTSSSMNTTSTTSPRDIKFSKYIPLPAIKQTRPSLLREKTYDVLEPVYVKGPLQDATATSPVENRVKLPEIKNNRIPTSKLKKNPQEILTTSASPPKKELLRTPPVNNLTTASINNNNNNSIRLKTGKIRQPFNPNQISKASMPESPTVFWFPV